MFIGFGGGVCAQDGKARYELGTKSYLYRFKIFISSRF
jgi:hypothetical protein